MRSLKRIIFGLLLAVILAFITFILVAKQHYVAPILMYHQVLPGAKYEYRLAVSVDTLERQMRFLKRHRYNVITVEELADLIRQKVKIPPRTVAITFDDGYADNYTYAFPILKKYKIPAAFFVITEEIGNAQKKKFGWEEIKEMQDSGVVFFGSHAVGPEPLVNLKSDDEIKRQIFESKRILEEKLGREVTVFSYPEGGFNAKIRQLVIDAGYKAAVATNPGRDYPDDDVFALKRLRISENAGNLFVFWVESSGLYTFMKELKSD